MSRGRILHCIPGMGGGGAERQLTYLAEGLSVLGWDVHVALISSGPNFQRLQQTGARIHPIVASGNYDPRIAWHLGRIIKRLKPDLVQLWMLQMEVLGSLASRWHGIPWILSERSSEGAYPRTWKNRLRIALTSNAAAIVANSSDGERYWADQPRVSAPRFVVPNALPYAEIQAATPADLGSLGFAASDRLILFVGRLSEEKNLWALLDAFEAVVAQSDARLAAIIGEGPLRPALHAGREASAVASRILLPGFVGNPWSWMKRADVFVSVSRFEGHPNTVLEAAACRTPLVLSDIPAHRAILDERSALFVSPDDPAAIAAAIQTTLAETGAAGTRAARAFMGVAELDVERIARAYECIYEQVLSRTDPQTRMEELHFGANQVSAQNRSDPAITGMPSTFPRTPKGRSR